MMRHEGTAKKEGARPAAKRCMTPLRQDQPPLQCRSPAARLRATAPPLATLSAPGLHSRRGVQAGAPASVFPQVETAAPAGRGTSSARHDRAAGRGPRGRGINARPLQASQAHVRVKCVASGELGQAKGPHFRWLTARRGRTRPV
jgi:hypothetical protein